jgi:hypothetical protein
MYDLLPIFLPEPSPNVPSAKVFLGKEVNKHGRQKQVSKPYLPFLHTEDPILNCVGNDNALDKDISHLAHPVDTIECLRFNSKRPTEVERNDIVGTGEVQADA